MEYQYLSESNIMTKAKFIANIDEDKPINVIQIMDINNLIIGNKYVIYIKDFYTYKDEYQDYNVPGDNFFKGTFVRLENDVAIFTKIQYEFRRNGYSLLLNAFTSSIDIRPNHFYTFKTKHFKVGQELLNNGRCKLFAIDSTQMELPVPTPAPENIEPVIEKIFAKIEKLKQKGEQHSSGVIYSDDPIIFVLVYLKLLEKYGNKCSVTTVDEHIFQLSSEIAFSGIEIDEFIQELGPQQSDYLGETLKDCVDRGVNIIIIPLVINFDNSSHANILIYKPKQKTIERFEPFGMDFTNDFDAAFKSLVEIQLKPFLGPLTYASPALICPTPQGLQSLEASLSGFDTKEGGGFCMMWSCFLTEMILMNPENTTKEIIDQVFAITKKDPLYLKQIIRGYVKDVEEMIDELIKSVSDDTFSFIESEDNNAKSIDVIKKHKDLLKNYAINLIVNSKKPLFNPTPLGDSKIGIGGKRRKYRNKHSPVKTRLSSGRRKSKKTRRKTRKNKRHTKRRR